MKNRRILFIDDEPFFADPYIRELERFKAEVVLEEEVINAIDAANSERTWDAIILDIMMPHPEDKAGLTANGLETGIWVLGEILPAVLANNIPVVVLTNRNLVRVQECLEIIESSHSVPVGLITARSKIETPRFLLPRLVKAAIDRFRP